MDNQHLLKYQNSSIKNSDEYYTRYDDIAYGIKHIKICLKDKIIYLPCDNPKISNFWKYFVNNFDNLNLKAVYASYIVQDNEPAFTYIKDKSGIRKIKRDDNGSFDTEASIKLMKKADIVITNPPFSLMAKHFYPLIQKTAKDYLIIAPITTFCYKSCMQSVISGRLYIANYKRTTSMVFDRPDGTQQKLGNVWWLSSFNLHINDNNFIHKHADMTYPKLTKLQVYFSPKAIDLSKQEISFFKKSSDIPSDYTGLMAVPVTFMNKINLRQFRIIGSGKPFIGKKQLFERVIIQNRLASRW